MSLKRSTIIKFTVICVSNLTSILLISPNCPGLLTPLPKLSIKNCMPKGFPISNMCLCYNGSFKFIFHCINSLFNYWLKLPSPVFAGPCLIHTWILTSFPSGEPRWRPPAQPRIPVPNKSLIQLLLFSL